MPCLGMKVIKVSRIFRMGSDHSSNGTASPYCYDLGCCQGVTRDLEFGRRDASLTSLFARDYHRSSARSLYRISSLDVRMHHPLELSTTVRDTQTRDVHVSALIDHARRMGISQSHSSVHTVEYA